MANKKGLGLPQTKGTFQIRGKVIGTESEKFYTEKITKTDKPWRSVRFGVKIDDNSTIYVELNGMEREQVYFSKKNKETNETIVENVNWSDRFKFRKEGFNLIGVNVGVKRIVNDKGITKNDNKRLTEFDACKEIAENLKDDMSIFVRGNIQYSTYEGKYYTKFVPTQVSLVGKDIDFDAEDFKPIADFTQDIIVTSINPNEDKTRATVEAKIVNYDSIENMSFIIENMSLAALFKKKIAPYTGIKVWGKIIVKENKEEKIETDCWGEKNEMEIVNAPTIRELIITGADPTTIDTITYSMKEIDKAIESIKKDKQAVNDFGDSLDNWGSIDEAIIDDEDPWGE